LQKQEHFHAEKKRRREKKHIFCQNRKRKKMGLLKLGRQKNKKKQKRQSGHAQEGAVVTSREKNQKTTVGKARWTTRAKKTKRGKTVHGENGAAQHRKKMFKVCKQQNKKKPRLGRVPKNPKLTGFDQKKLRKIQIGGKKGANLLLFYCGTKMPRGQAQKKTGMGLWNKETELPPMVANDPKRKGARWEQWAHTQAKYTGGKLPRFDGKIVRRGSEN